MGSMVMSDTVRLTLYQEPINDGDTSSLTNLSVDFGIYVPQTPVVNTLTLGNLIFEDTNNNGVKDPNELGVPNIPVELKNIGLDGIKNTADDQVLATQSTNSNGNYLFTNIGVGVYYVKFTLPTGYLSSTGEGANDRDTSGTYEPSRIQGIDNADNGTQMGSMVMSNIVRYALSNDTSNLTIDFGVYRPAAPVDPCASVMIWANAGVDRTICEGDSTQLGAQGGTHYVWSPSASLNRADIFNPMARPTTTTTYVVRVANDAGCFAFDTVVVNVLPRPTILTDISTYSACQNDSIVVTQTLNQPITTWQLTGSAGYRNVAVNGSTIQFTAMLNGSLNNLTLILGGGAANCQVTKNLTFVRTSQPRADFVVIEPFCAGNETTVLFTGTASAGAVLNYDLGTDGTIVRRSAATATRPAGDTTVIRWATFGSKLVRLNLNDGGCTDSKLVSVLVKKSPIANIANNDTTICVGAPIQLYGSAGLLTCTYTWSPAQGLSATNIANPIATVSQPMTYVLTIMDINGCLGRDTVRISVDTSRPILGGVPADVTVACNSNIPAVATVVSNRPTDVVRFVELRQDYPAGQQIRAIITRTWTANNVCGGSTTASQTITVRDDSRPTLVGVPANVTLTCNEPMPALPNVTATDNCGGTTTIRLDSVRTNGNCAANYSIVRTWTATDEAGNTATASQTISYNDLIAPTISIANPVMVLQCSDSIPTTQPTVSDACDANPRVTMTEISTDSSCIRTIKRTWTATDACGNSASALQVIIIRDNVAPTFANVPSNITLACSDTSGLSNVIAPTATDACGTPRVTLNTTHRDLTCGFEMVRTWTATDACGNTATATQTVAVTDNQAPRLVSGDARLTNVRNGDTLTYDCLNFQIFEPTAFSAVDACDPNVRVSFQDLGVRRGNCAVDGFKLLMTCEWSAIDRCGNRTSFLIYIKITDSQAPVLSGIPVNVTVEGESQIPVAPINVTATDQCDTGRIRVVMTETRTTPTGAGCGFALTRTWSATDDCGNVATRAQVINVACPPCVRPQIVVVKVNSTCRDNNGSATLQVDNVNNYSFAWLNAAGATTNSRNNLAAGSYSVVVSRLADPTCSDTVRFAIVADTSNCFRDLIAPRLTLRTVDRCVGGMANVCLEIPFTDIQNYTITQNGQPYAAGFTACTGGGASLQFPTGVHHLRFVNPQGYYDSLTVKVICLENSEVIRPLEIGQSGRFCPTDANVTNPASVVNECPQSSGRNATFAIGADNCVTYTGITVGLDSACLRYVTANGDTIRVLLIANVTQPICRINPIAVDTIVSTTCVADSVLVCVPMSIDSIYDYNITVDGRPYTGTIEGCNLDTSFAYTYFTIPGRGTSASGYRLDYWTRNGDTIRSASIPNITALLDSMNLWDTNGRWTLDPVTLTLRGGNVRNVYGSIKMTRLSDGSFGVMQLNRSINPRSTYVRMPRGTHQIRFTRPQTGCFDELTAIGTCVTPRTVVMNLILGASETTCLETNELLGRNYAMRNVIGSLSGNSVFFSTVRGTACVKAAAMRIGTERATYVLTDEWGISDTTHIIVNVAARALVILPEAKSDSTTTAKNKPVIIEVLRNDNLQGNAMQSLRITAKPKYGEALVTSNGNIIYTPMTDHCGIARPDQFSYTVCTAAGCATAMVTVTVLCDKIIVFNALSPNNDGVNDRWTIEGLEKYPNNRVRLFNRWGNEVFTAKNYQNDYEGTWNGGYLPDGTYFYLIEDGQGQSYSGYLQIHR
jgi:gliding motility-associated-like protein